MKFPLFSSHDPSIASRSSAKDISTSQDEDPEQTILRALETQLPVNIEELREATVDAFTFGDKHLGLWARDKTMHSTIAYEEWVSLTSELERTFCNPENPVLGEQLLAFLAMTNEEMLEPRTYSNLIALLRHTAPFAQRITTLVDRLCIVTHMQKTQIIDALRKGDLTATLLVNDFPIQPSRVTLLGVLARLSDRLSAIAKEKDEPAPPESLLWNLDQVPHLPPKVSLQDPFSQDEETQKYWEDRDEKTVFRVSEHKTISLIYELESLRAVSAQDPENIDYTLALAAIEEWLERNLMLYRDGTEKDIGAYHLGMETPEMLELILKSLDAVKHNNPEFFVALAGINPNGGKSPYFGSFIHTALYKTQHILREQRIEHLSSEDAFFAADLSEAFSALMTLNQYVPIWNTKEALSDEGLKAITQRMMADKTGNIVVPVVVLTLFARLNARTKRRESIARQLDTMKSMDLKALFENLSSKLDDLEHPMLALRAIADLPLLALRDPKILIRLTAIFGEELTDDTGIFQEKCRTESPDVVRKIFHNILAEDIDDASHEEKARFQFLRIAVLESMNQDSTLRRILRGKEELLSPSFSFFLNLIDEAGEDFLGKHLERYAKKSGQRGDEIHIFLHEFQIFCSWKGEGSLPSLQIIQTRDFLQKNAAKITPSVLERTLNAIDAALAERKTHKKMLEIFRDGYLGFDEVEQGLFEKKSYYDKESHCIIDKSERAEAYSSLEQKLQEPDIQDFLGFLKENPKERNKWMLVYRTRQPVSLVPPHPWVDRFLYKYVEQDAYRRNQEIPAWNIQESWARISLTSGWYFVQKEPDLSTRDISHAEQSVQLVALAENVQLDSSLIRRRTPIEVVYDIIVARSTGAKILKKAYDWTSQETDPNGAFAGEIVTVGDADSSGIRVSAKSPTEKAGWHGACVNR